MNYRNIINGSGKKNDRAINECKLKASILGGKIPNDANIQIYSLLC